MGNGDSKTRRCLGRNRNLGRCTRQIGGRFFCHSHKFQPIILSSFIVFTLGTSTITYISFFQDSQNNETTTLNRQRDIIIAKHYRDSLGEFLAKFRIFLVCLPDYRSMDGDIINVFEPDNLTRPVKVGEITAELIEKLFTTYGFSMPVGQNCKFDANKQPVTVSDLFLFQIGVLNKHCSSILIKYAGSGHPKLINKIEVLRNRANNLIGPYGPKDFSHYRKDDLHWISEFFMQIKDSYSIVEEMLQAK